MLGLTIDIAPKSAWLTVNDVKRFDGLAYLITLIGIVYTIVIGLSATGLVQIGVPAQYAGAIVLLISVLYNIAFPRNPAPIQSS